MTLAVAAPDGSDTIMSPAVPIVILGADALLAAAPATPVQLAHACLRAGFGNVVPASWGDELIAAAVLKRLPRFGDRPAIQCSCPIVAHRLLTTGGDLRPVLLPLVSPPVALARYLRALSHPTRMRVTYVGACPGAVDDSIDIRMTPDALMAMLAERQIVLDDQPRVFESIIPPDRRRFRSQPGGTPTADHLWSETGSRSLAEVESDDFVAEIAQLLLIGANVLIDAGPRLGCVCSGAIAGVPPGEARPRIEAAEPPRATTPVVDEDPLIDLDLPIPATPRTPVDVSAVAATSQQGLSATRTGGQFEPRISPARGVNAPGESRSARPSPTAGARPVSGSLPVSRDADGRRLPRAYVARRKSPPGRNGSPPTADAPPDRDALDLDEISSLENGAIPVSIETPRSESSAPAPASRTEGSAHVDPGAVANAPYSRSIATTIAQSGLGVKQIVLLVLTMVFIAAAVSAAVTLYVTHGSRPPAAETTQP
ncbi:MAG TPA: [Fe-Fe] hydrogenase large subunit C-terminal domain-containing protein [Gemmatimonadaceae bacterium]|nr:[Fe-Fe] hydrogenase large subunit C-terminal domain-containing protein [Gemmatimonadaceae bacterium]